MDRIEAVPTWKKALAVLGYSILNLFIGLIVMVVIAINFEAYLPKGSPVVVGIMAVSLLLALPVTLWWRYQLVNKDRLVAERKARESEWARKQLKARNLPLGSIETAFKVIFYIGLGLGGIYIAFQVIAWLPVSVAVILGAVFIGLCILGVSQR